MSAGNGYCTPGLANLDCFSLETVFSHFNIGTWKTWWNTLDKLRVSAGAHISKIGNTIQNLKPRQAVDLETWQYTWVLRVFDGLRFLSMFGFLAKEPNSYQKILKVQGELKAQFPSSSSASSSTTFPWSCWRTFFPCEKPWQHPTVKGAGKKCNYYLPHNKGLGSLGGQTFLNAAPWISWFFCWLTALAKQTQTEKLRLRHNKLLNWSSFSLMSQECLNQINAKQCEPWWNLDHKSFWLMTWLFTSPASRFQIATRSWHSRTQYLLTRWCKKPYI